MRQGRWRTLGYVPDSEASEDDATPPPNTSPRVYIRPATVPAQESIQAGNHSPIPHLEPPLSGSLQPSREAPVDAALSDQDSDASDLSSLSKLFADGSNPHTSTAARGDWAVNQPPLPDVDQRERNLQLGSRRLRQRQEVQKHPYTIEEARYRRILRDRGESPICVAINSQRREVRENDATSQSPISDAESPVPSSRFSSRGIASQLRFPSLEAAPSGLAENRGLRLPGSHRQKRRRVVQSESDSDAGLSPTSNGNSKSEQSRNAQRTTTSSSPQASLPSALQSKWDDSSDPGRDGVASRSSETSTAGAFKSPNGISNFVITSQPSTLSKPRSLAELNHTVISSEPESGSVSENEEDAVKRVGRRLKGVLPRSWVRLELQKQLQQSSKKPKASKAARDTTGIARRRQTSHQAGAPITFDDSDTPSEAVARSPNIEPRVRPALALPPSQSDAPSQPDAPAQSDNEPPSSPGSQMEHDVIDLTMPPSRPGGKGPNSRSRQQKLEDAVRPRQSIAQGANRVHGRPVKLNKPKSIRKPRRSDNADQDVSVMPGPAVLPAEHHQARRRKDLGRQSSIRRYTRVQTVEDVADAQNIPNRLEWRNGEHHLSHRRQGRPATLNRNPNIRQPVVSSPEACRQGVEAEKANQSRNQTIRQKPAHFRTAQLESLESEFKSRNHRSAFHTDLLKASSNHKIQSRMIVDPETRYRQQTLAPFKSNIHGTIRTAEAAPPGLSREDASHDETYPVIDPESNFCQSPPLGRATVQTNDVHRYSADPVSSFDRIHSVDFGIVRLTDDPLIHFQKDTFIGSGEFHTAVMMNHRNLDIPTSDHAVHFSNVQCVWTAWDQGLTAGIKIMLQRCRNVIEEFPVGTANRESGKEHWRELENVSNVLRQMLFANSHHLYFLDPIDRSSFRKVLTLLLKPLMDSTVRAIDKPFDREPVGTLLHILVLEMTMAAQVLAIGPSDEPDQLRDMISLAATAILRKIVQNGLSAIRDFIHAGRLVRDSQHGIEVESVVAAYHTLKRADIPRSSFWDVMHAVLEPRVATATDLTALDVTWLALFTVLPILDIDARGALSRDKNPITGDWRMLKILIDKTLYLFKQYPGPRSLNNYVRTILHRCHTLVQTWGWSQCEGLIGATFDFFSNNRLAPMHNEVVKGSPEYLSQLDGSPSLDVLPGDHSFGIFLKLLSVALINLKQIHPPEKIAGIIWRCIPNHNRRHRKEDDLREADLDALRNHHDLLCTLFWHAPDGIRPRLLRLMRDLVDHGVSHQEVCRLNANTWSRIGRLLLSKPGFPPHDLSQWLQTFTNQAVAQYRLARVEIEAHPSAALGRLGHSRIEEHIRRNQEPVLITIHTIVTGMTLAINSASSKAQVVELLQHSSLDKVLSLAVDRRDILARIMLVFSSFIALPESTGQADRPTKSDESQEFGDWPEETVSIDFVTSNVFTLLSNLLASEGAVDDDSILLVVNTWVQVIVTLLRRGEKKSGSVLRSVSRIVLAPTKRRRSTPHHDAVLLCTTALFWRAIRHVPEPVLDCMDFVIG